MKRNLVLGVAAAATLVAGFVTATYQTALADLSGRSVKIGVMLPLTGKGAEWGEAGQIGSQLAADEINEAGGIGGVKIKLVFYDDHGAEAEGITIINKLA